MKRRAIHYFFETKGIFIEGDGTLRSVLYCLCEDRTVWYLGGEPKYDYNMQLISNDRKWFKLDMPELPDMNDISECITENLKENK